MAFDQRKTTFSDSFGTYLYRIFVFSQNNENFVFETCPRENVLENNLRISSNDHLCPPNPQYLNQVSIANSLTNNLTMRVTAAMISLLIT